MADEQSITRCRKHEWDWLFEEPPPDASKEIQIEWFGLSLSDLFNRMTICRHCGALGAKRRGYSRGGVHRIKTIVVSEERATKYKSRAAAWSAQLHKDL
jgi:hypothetical protein